MTARWAMRLYGLVVAIYPRRFRRNYGAEMKLVFQDLLDDPEVSRKRIWSSVMRDIVSLTGGGVLPGALIGFLVLFIWWVTRSDIVPFEPNLALALIAGLFVAAGFIGTRRSGSFLGGISVGFVAGLMSALTTPGEYWLFGHAVTGGVMESLLMGGIAAAIVMLFVTVGAELATFKLHSDRMRRGMHAFVGAWRQDSELTP